MIQYMTAHGMPKITGLLTPLALRYSGGNSAINSANP